MNLTRREIIKATTLLPLSTAISTYTHEPSVAAEAFDRQIVSEAIQRGPRLTFLGNSSNAYIHNAIRDHVLNNPKRTIIAVGDTNFSKSMHELNWHSSNRSQVSVVPVDDETVDAQKLLLANFRSDPDELIFHKKEFRKIHETQTLDQLQFAWEIGHNVTCGIVATDPKDFFTQVSEILNETPYGFDNREIDKIDVFFERKDMSAAFRSQFRSDPESKIYRN